MSNKDEIDELNHIGDGRILATKDELLALKKMWQDEARVDELNIFGEVEFEDVPMDIIRYKYDRINQLNGDK